MGSKYAPVRSVRVDNDTWGLATARAQREGMTMSQVLQTLVVGYGEEIIDLPEFQMVWHTEDGERRLIFRGRI